MNRTQDLEKADKELKELSSRIDSFKIHIQHLESDIAILTSLRIQFIQNLATLKDEKIVAVMEQYKKVKTDLRTVENRLYALRIDFNNHSVALERAEKMLLECRANYVILLRNMDGRIIKGNFGGKE